MKETKARKGSKDYLIERCDEAINDLVYDKTSLYKAYNYYHGFRDKYLYENYEKQYGIASPTHITFTPLVRKHIDAIVGEYIANDPSPKISCKDPQTIANILRDKLLQIAKENHAYAKKLLDQSIYSSLMGGDQLKQLEKLQDPVITKELQEIEESINRSFISNYEIAALTIAKYVTHSRDIDFKNKLSEILKDILIGGQGYYRVNPTSAKTNFEVEVLDPINSFPERDPKSNYIKNGYRFVYRRWMSKLEILIKYGDELTLADIDSIDDYSCDYAGMDSVYINACNARCRCGSDSYRGIVEGEAVLNHSRNFAKEPWDLIPVYEVEWIDYDKVDKKIIGKRYEVIRIGSDVYILRGEDKNSLRSIDSPNKTRLRTNGMFFSDRTGVPFSLILSTVDQLDLYDLILYKISSVLALSGIKGANVDIAHLPAFLGDSPEERLMKYMSYRKAGLNLFDTSLEGEAPLMLNTTFNGFDDTIAVQSIQSYLSYIQLIELQVSLITGVFQERLGGIQAYDAVNNVKIGMQLSFIITNQYTQMLDTFVSEILLDCIDMAKIVYKNGFSGLLIIGGNALLFKILPLYYTTTSYDVHVVTSKESVQEKEAIKQLAMQLAGQGGVDPEILVSVLSSNSLTLVKELVLNSIAKKKQENDQLKLTLQLLQEALKQLQLMLKLLEASTKKIQQLDERRLAFEQQSETNKQKIDWYKAQQDAEYLKKQLELIKERTRLELLLLFDTNSRNDKVRNDMY